MKKFEVTQVFLVLFLLVAFAQTMACEDEMQEEETMLAYADPTPWANDGLGCITDSECEGVE